MPRERANATAVSPLSSNSRTSFAHSSALRRCAIPPSYPAVPASHSTCSAERVHARSQIAELHFFGGASLTGLSAEGSYCLDVEGRYGTDCDDPPVRLTDAEASGFYAAANAGIALDLARQLESFFHGGRLAVHAAFGSMPTVVSGLQQSPTSYSAAGISLSAGFGRDH